MLECRVAQEDDWLILKKFYSDIYRPGHPLRNRGFWRWRFSDVRHGQAYICVDDGKIAGQVAAANGGGYAWIINVFLHQQYRGKGILRDLYALAGEKMPLAATNVNAAGMKMYRNMGWIRYCDLQRFSKINPQLKSLDRLCGVVELKEALTLPSGDHYWNQPGIDGLLLADGSTAVNQLDVGGFRLVDIKEVDRVADLAFQSGATWIDYITSWNDPICRTLDDLGWSHGDKDQVPWDLNPVVKNSKANITYLAQDHMPKDFIVKRYYSDHGRVGSLPAAD